MKCFGTSYDVEGLDAYTYDIPVAIVTDERIAIEWDEDEGRFLGVLHSTDGGNHYTGSFGLRGPQPGCEMEAWRYQSHDGDVLLWLKWSREDNGNGGTNIMCLSSKSDS